MNHTIIRAMIALSILGSATLLFSCKEEVEVTVYDGETLMTESSENRTVTMMENGKRSYKFTTPLVEGYSLAKNPYQEFRRGVKITTYTSDSIPLVNVILTANYAIYYENQKLWEAKGNVVVHKHNRKGADTTVTGLTEVYTQQLFWNATTGKIYSNVDTKILQPDGWHFGVGFDSDEELKNIHFRKYSSEMEFEMSQQERRERPDSLRDNDGDRRDDGGNREKRQATNNGNRDVAKDKSRTGRPSSSVPNRGVAPSQSQKSDMNALQRPMPQRPSESTAPLSLQSRDGAKTPKGEMMPANREMSLRAKKQ